MTKPIEIAVSRLAVNAQALGGDCFRVGFEFLGTLRRKRRRACKAQNGCKRCANDAVLDEPCQKETYKLGRIAANVRLCQRK